MAKDLKHYQGVALAMMIEDQKRDAAYREYEAMDRCEWELPPEMQSLPWVRTVVSTDPHDAISAGTRVLATLEDKVTIQPLSIVAEGKQRANAWEKCLSWQMFASNRRRKTRVQKSAVRSALKYDEVIGQVIDLENQVGQMALFKGNAGRYAQARRYGRFIIKVYNPRFVHVRYSDVMAEQVLLAVRQKAQDVVDEWGDLANAKLRKLAEDGAEVIYYDYWDRETRAVWCEIGEGGQAIPILKPMAHGLAFLPWAACIGGDDLETESEDQRQPILYSVRKSRQWQTQNIVKSLYTSEVIAHAAAPRYKEEGGNPESSEVDYGDPARTAKVPAGNTLQPLQQPPIDQALLQIDDRVTGAISKSTVSQVLMGGELPGGTAFAALNLSTQTALGALKPAKELAERWLAEVYTLMLLWVQHTGKPLYGYGQQKRGVSSDYGRQYVIEPDDIEPDGLYIQVELNPDVPTDRIQRINAAIMAKQIGLSNESALDQIGVQDPNSEIMQMWFERLLEAQMTSIIQAAQAEQAMAQQNAQQQMQLQAQQQAMVPQGIPNVQGQGFNPAAGGIPPALMNPEATREMQGGMDQMGNEMFGGEM